MRVVSLKGGEFVTSCSAARREWKVNGLIRLRMDSEARGIKVKWTACVEVVKDWIRALLMTLLSDRSEGRRADEGCSRNS